MLTIPIKTKPDFWKPPTEYPKRSSYPNATLIKRPTKDGQFHNPWILSGMAHFEPTEPFRGESSHWAVDEALATSKQAKFDIRQAPQAFVKRNQPFLSETEALTASAKTVGLTQAVRSLQRGRIQQEPPPSFLPNKTEVRGQLAPYPGEKRFYSTKDQAITKPTGRTLGFLRSFDQIEMEKVARRDAGVWVSKKVPQSF